MKVTLFVTCLVDMFETNVGKATVEVLERLGCEIEFPEAQVCCGQPAYNSGHVEAAKEAMKHMIETFEDAEYIVTPSGSCATMFHEYPHVFKDDPKWAKRAQKVADKTYEFTQFIVDVLKVTDVGASLPGIATIQILSYDTYAWSNRGTRDFIIKCKRVNCERVTKCAKLLRVWGNVFSEDDSNF